MVTLAIVISLLFWLTKTETGLRWALQQAPDVISVNKVSGHLSDLTFSGLKIRLDGTQVSIASGQLKWRLSDLLKRTLRIENLLLNKLDVQITATEPQASEPFEAWKGIDLPVDINVDNIKFNTLTINRNGDQIGQVEQLIASVKVNDNLLQVNKLKLFEKSNRLDLTGKLDLSADKDGIVDITNVVEWDDDQKRFSENGSINLVGSIVGTWRSLELNQQISSPFETSVSLTIENALTDQVSWRGQLQTQGSDLRLSDQPAITLGQGDFEVSGEFSPSVGLPGLVARFSGSMSGGNQVFSNWSLNTDIDFINDTLNINRFNLLEQPVPVSSGPNIDSGELIITGVIVGLSAFLDGQNNGNANADLSGNWRNLGWPINQAAKQITSSGNFSARGVPKNFSVNAKASGQSYKKRLQAHTEIHVVDRTIDISAMKLQSGTSRVDVSGTLAERIDLTWKVSSPDLSELMPQLSGDLNSNGTLSGELNAPRISASASSSYLTFNKLQLYNLNLSSKGLFSASPEAISLSANIERIEQDSSELARDLKMTLGGSGQAHTLSTRAFVFGKSVISINAQGNLTERGWKGQLDKLDIELSSSSQAHSDQPISPEWKLREPVELILDNNMLTSDRACLNNQAQSICAEISANEKNVVANGIVSELELSNLDPLMSLYDSRLSGKLNGQFKYNKSTSDSASTLFAEVQTSNSTLSIQRSNSVTETLAIKSAELSISQNPTLTATSSIFLENNDQITSEISVASAFESENFLDEKLNGRIIAVVNDLSKLQILSGPMSDLKGSLDADIRLDGSISAPQVGMQTYLKNGQLALPDLGISLSDIELSAKSNGKQEITLEGGLSSGKGQLEINGDFNLFELSKPRISIALKGDNLELMKTPEIHVDGNLDTKIVITSDLVDVSGNVRLINADLDFQLPENAILASEDVVLLGEEQAKQASQQKIRLQIGLGDQTHIRAQGLDAYLVGNIELQQDPGALLRANGQIDIKNGRYDAYNQKLEIDKGQLIYNGGPVDDPSLVLRAQKSVDSITAGVSVTGRASSPILQLYSTPSMPDQDILSVLIFDKRIGDLASQDGLTLLKIANSLRGDGKSRSQVDVLTQNIQESLGLSNLELQLNGNAPSLIAGKQLSSKFYIGYGYGLLDAAQSLILRYKINPFWSIQGDLGVDSGADLRYQIER